MLEGLATWFLNNYLGKYLENLDTDQLSISLLSGQVELDNVPLRKDALRFLEPALEVKSGVVGHIKLTIPVSRLRSEPWSLALEGVTIVLGPQKFSQYDEEADEQVRLETKLAALDGIEGDWRAAQDNTGYYPVTSSWLSYGSSYIGTIVENLQLEIKDVHLRYEDGQTALGVMVESLSAQTCDQSWSPKFVYRDPLQGQMDAFKLVSLVGMSAYLDTEAAKFGEMKPAELREVMSVGKMSLSSQYLLHPISATMTIKRNCVNKPLNSRRLPRLQAELELDSLQLGLSDLQLRRLVSSGRSLVMLRKARQYWRWRPEVEVRQGPRRWWQYAITSTLDLITARRRSNNWPAILACARDNVNYVKAFMEQLENPTLISEDLKIVKETQDNSRSYDELRALREIAVFWVQKKQNRSKVATPERKVSQSPATTPGEEVTSPTLQRWFPLWGGWYDSDNKKDEQTKPVELEEYLQDAIKEDHEVFGISHKDVVFSHIAINLKQALIQLTRTSSKSEATQLFEVEFQTVKVEHEHRPRTRSYLFSLHVGSVWLRDKITHNSLFPLLISPQSSENAPLHAKLSQSRFSEFAKSIQTFLPSSLGSTKEEEAPIFYFLYEKKPFSSKADHRIHIRSQPLNVVYNPIVIKVVTEFFTIPEDVSTASHLSDQIKSAALDRIQEAKERTKEEFTRNINYILKGNTLDRKVWDVMLDLSAPKLLIPDHFEDKNASLIVVDFGKLVLSNKNAIKPQSKEENVVRPSASDQSLPEDDEEELFLTPASSPGAESDRREFTFPEIICDEVEAPEQKLHSAMYDTYSVDLNNMQIIVGCVKDNWRGAHLKGNSSLHMVDKFSISLNVERRTVETSDPAWPSLIVSGTLPGLRLHFNEDKLVTLKHAVARLLGPQYGASRDCGSQTDNEGEQVEGEGLDLFGEWQEPSSDTDLSSKLLVAHFCVSDLSVELQSSGKPVAEIQVTNMKAGVTRRPYDTNLSMSVHSLLVVDALQTFGPDYELLVASHKGVCVDTVSGSLRGSDPASPVSPASPTPSISPTPTQADLTKALSSLDTTTLASPPPVRRFGSPSFISDVLDPAALISIDVMLVSPSCPTLEENEELRIVNIQFNSLDVIANQETIIELISFSRRVFPPEQSAFKPQFSNPSTLTQESSCQTDLSIPVWEDQLCETLTLTSLHSLVSHKKTEVSAEFQRLNVLLLRAGTGRRIGTALLTDARVQATLSQAVTASGSLGGLQVMNLVSASPVHQRIISVGREPLVEEVEESCLSPLSLSLDQSNHAFTFDIVQSVSQQTGEDEGETEKEDKVSVTAQMSSVVYIHSSAFLDELNSCADDFKRCMSVLAQSISAAATDLALGIVQRRTESFQAGRERTPGRGLVDTPSHTNYPSSTTFHLPPPAPTPRPLHSHKFDANIELSLVLATPVVVFPRNEASKEVLVAHLGQITVSNEILSGWEVRDDPTVPLGTSKLTRYNIQVSHVNLNSLNLQQKLDRKSGVKNDNSILSMTALSLYDSSKYGVPIIHDTNLEIYVDRIVKTEMLRKTESFCSGLFMEQESILEGLDDASVDLVQIKGKVVNPLKVSLSRNQYQQLIDTLKSPDKPRVQQNLQSSFISTSTPVNTLERRNRARRDLFASKEKEKSVPIEGRFELPVFSLELRRDALNANIEPGIVSLTFTEFGLTYDKPTDQTSTMQMALKGLLMEDLLLDENSSHRNLMVSSACPPSLRRTTNPTSNISSSCPDLLNLRGSLASAKSLPDRLDTRTVFGISKEKKTKVTQKRESKSPSTPPPSTCSSPLPSEMINNDLRNEENLVHLSILNIDPSNKDLRTVYDGINKFVNVDFNSLDINFNQQTWVVVLDFFGIGSGGEQETEEGSQTGKNEDDGLHATSIDIQVKSLAICFNKNETDLFKASVLNYSSKIFLKDGNFEIEGQLGNFCIKDFTNFGFLYKDRFLCRGEQILKFKIFKFGPKDEELQREFDIEVNLKMTSITYVHTQRFWAVLMDFFNQFQQLQDTMNTHRARTSRKENTVGFAPQPWGTGRGSRIKLNIQADSPLLVLPMSSSSTKVLMADLGFLEVSNCFKFAGDQGTISASKLSTLKTGELGGRRSRATSGSRSSQRSRSSARSADRRSARSGRGMSSDEDFHIPPVKQVPSHKCLLDVMNIRLRSMDLVVGERLSAFINEEERQEADVEIGGCLLRKQTQPLLRDKLELKLQVERNLDKGFCHNVPDLSIKGLLTKVHAVVDIEQYKLIRGFLAHNLGEQIESGDEADIFTPTVVTENETLWTTTFMDMELQDVSVDLVNQHEEPPNKQMSGLARVNFIKSRLVYESFSDFSKDVDLVSQEILLTDTRYSSLPANQRANVFSCILQPMKVEERKSILQAEVHYRSTKDVNRFTILLNNMRMMCILDWWLAVLGFISKDCENPRQVSPDDPGVEKKEVTKMIELTEEPLYPTAGVITRRNPVIQTSGPVFELKLNITDSELVVLADTSQWESSAVILRSTTVLAFRPAWKERPLSCNLNNAEVFSCVIGKEEETALSIIDPVTINVEIWGRGEVAPASKGLLDVSDEKEIERVAEIQLQQLNIRLSYHDAIMFRHILNSLPKQAQDALSGVAEKETKREEVEVMEPANVRAQLSQLSSLGFSRSDCRRALQECDNQLEDAALWLTQNASPERQKPDPTLTGSDETFLAHTSVSFSAIQLKTSCINLVVIDDCKDADCPLVELSLASLNLKQRHDRCGSLHASLSSSYYNRTLSAWEPAMEPWRCSVDWTSTRLGSLTTRTSLNIKTVDLININLTQAMLELFRVVKTKWGEDYYNLSKDESQTNLVQTPPAYRRRTPYVPFALYNNTGCPLMFHTSVVDVENKNSRRSRHVSGNLLEYKPEKEWKRVEVNETLPFLFETRSKQRHQNTHHHQLHQVVVRVEGWKEVKPVTVDRVGTFFRNVSALRNTSSLTEIPPARIVFEVKMQGSAQKLITVRSALEIENKLSVPIKVKMENTALRVADVREFEVNPNVRLPVPILYCWARMTLRPGNYQWKFSDQQVHWCHILSSSDNSLELHQCQNSVKPTEPYMFSVSVRRLGFPPEAVMVGPGSKAWIQPAHLITVLPPVTLTNLLPCQLYYSVQNSVRGDTRPGSDTPLHIDTNSMFIIDFYLENFPGRGSVIMHPGTSPFEARIQLTDNKSRPLFITVKVSVRYGGAVFISVFAPYWIVNKTGLPMLFKQEGDKVEAAGQFEEHELARMMSPLLFSFTERDSSLDIVARVGIGLNPEGKPKWCKNFFVQPGSTVRRLRVQPGSHDKRPEWVYIVGIDVRQGRGRHNVTTIITFSPRFQLYNQSQHKIQFSQLGFATTFHDPGAEKTYLTAHTNSSLAFHWPRLDLDQLLCMRLLDVPGCQWSGGFIIEKVDSLQLSIRDVHGRARFLRVEISLHYSTYCVIISSADNFPPPFRVDNFSEVPITFYQTGVSDQLLRTVVKPHQAVPYALDGPVLLPHLTVSAPGGSLATYNMNITGAGNELTYENFIYIVMTASCELGWDEGYGELVLDVPEGSRIVLNVKAGAKRSQLWRMTSTGMLQHEGSSPPQDPKSKKRLDQSHILVLDIAGPADRPDSFTPLMLRKPDLKRTLTQTWRFTEDGRLCCQHSGLYVQAKEGYLGLCPGRDLVLGPTSSLCLSRTASGLPTEQAVSRQKLRPGSGYLGVRVTTDGPTRVLQINDIQQNRDKLFARAEEPEWLETKRPWLITQQGRAGEKRKESDTNQHSLDELQVVLVLKGGIGISLVTREPPEELLYICLNNIVIDYQSLPSAQLLDGSVQSFQVDSQVADSTMPVVLYVSPSSKTDDTRHLPAIHFAINRTPPSSANNNAEIFKHIILTVKNITLNIEEEMVYKLYKFSRLISSEGEEEEVEDNVGWEHQLSVMAASSQLTRYYCGTLKLSLSQVKLSVQKSNKLTREMKEMKRNLGLSLITFEDAAIELDPFNRLHPFETLPFLSSIIAKHYRDEMLSQAVLILGSTDFLGNPIGFMNDLSEGVSGLIDGDLGGLVKNVTHGAANSAAKVTGSLSHGLSKVSLDSKYDEKRLMIKRKHSDGGKQHLVAGLKGLGFGVLGGLTSVITEPIEGAASDGVSGFLTGIGWGVVGTLSKPAIGVLDLATGAANAVRESSRSAHRSAPAKVRGARVVQGPGGILALYSEKEAQGQTWLYKINGRRYEELYVGFEQLSEEHLIVVSSERVIIFSLGQDGRERAHLTVGYSELELARTVAQHDLSIARDVFYLEIVRRTTGRDDPTASSKLQRPQVRCESQLVAEYASNTINCAKSQYEETRQSVPAEEDFE